MTWMKWMGGLTEKERELLRVVDRRVMTGRIGQTMRVSVTAQKQLAYWCMTGEWRSRNFAEGA